LKGGEVDIGFIEIMGLMGASTKMKSTNNYCPFCGKPSLKLYPDTRKAHCHNESCAFHGDPILMYAKWRGLEYAEAVSELAQKYEKGLLRQKTATTLDEARKELAEDLMFLAWVRMFLAFYNDSERDFAYYQQRSGESKAVFSRVLNGQIEDTSHERWKRVIAFLKSDIDLKGFIAKLNDSSSFEKAVASTYKPDVLKKLVRSDSKI
jgi:hypothetical protein